MTRAELVDGFASSLGVEKAAATVDAGCRVLGFGGRELTHEQMLTLLDHLAKEEGIVGTVARFVKVRAILGHRR